MSHRKQTIEVGKTSIVHSSWSKIITFTDVEGNERQIDDTVGHVMRLIDVIQNGSGKAVQGNVTVDNTITGIPPNNLRPVMGGQGRAQWTEGTFLGGTGEDPDADGRYTSVIVGDL